MLILTARHSIMEGKEELSAEEDALVRGVIPGYKSGNFCRALDPSRFVFPRRLDMGAVKKMEVYEDDVFIVTPPKCGTTWYENHQSKNLWLVIFPLFQDPGDRLAPPERDGHGGRQGEPVLPRSLHRDQRHHAGGPKALPSRGDGAQSGEQGMVPGSLARVHPEG